MVKNLRMLLILLILLNGSTDSVFCDANAMEHCIGFDALISLPREFVRGCR